MFNEVGSSIIHKNCIDKDSKNSIVTIIIYLAEVIISILNGGFSEKCHDDKAIDKFLKNIEEESSMLHEYFYKIDKRIDDEKIYNYNAKSFSRILEDYENRILMNLCDYFNFKKILATFFMI